eukprot:COSAG02_NODE_22087_length_763_cov_7.540663_1_plen_81_part_00
MLFTLRDGRTDLLCIIRGVRTDLLCIIRGVRTNLLCIIRGVYTDGRTTAVKGAGRRWGLALLIRTPDGIVHHKGRTDGRL